MSTVLTAADLENLSAVRKRIARGRRCFRSLFAPASHQFADRCTRPDRLWFTQRQLVRFNPAASESAIRRPASSPRFSPGRHPEKEGRDWKVTAFENGFENLDSPLVSGTRGRIPVAGHSQIMKICIESVTTG